MFTVAGCHKQVAATAPPPPPPAAAPAPAASANIRVTPSAITAGQSATLSWNTANASSASIDGIGTVAATGSRTIYPASSTTYSLTAHSAAGNAEASARVTVNPAAAPATVSSLTEEQLFDQNVKDIFFNYANADLRPADRSVADKDASFLEHHATMKVVVEGHCDERGSEEYNIALGESRAQSMRSELVADGIPAGNVKVISYGKEKPFCTESDEQCWQQNRRDHMKLDQ
jgi:peptidoglycan-associated lipoprotein